MILLLLAALPATWASLGHIYAVSSNGTTNDDTFLDVNLDTWEISTGPDLGRSYDTFGQAAAIQDGVYWTFDMGQPLNADLTGIDITSKSIAFRLNTSLWPSGGPFFFDSIFAIADGALLVVGAYGSAKPDLISLYHVESPKSSPRVTLLGNVSCPGYCEDGALDAASSTLYFTSGASDTASGSLVAVSLGPGAPAVTGTVPLADFFDFKQFSPAEGGLFGLSLWRSAAGIMRNVTRLRAPGFSPESAGPIGDGMYVVLEDGPKAYDEATRRAFYMMATGPFAEFDVVALDLSATPPKILETPGLCGFIGCARSHTQHTRRCHARVSLPYLTLLTCTRAPYPSQLLPYELYLFTMTRLADQITNKKQEIVIILP